MNVIDKKINWTAKNLTKKKVMQSQDVKNFYENHVVATQYCFQIRKCYDKSCPYHKPIRMNLEEFKKIPWLPMPKLRLSKKEESYQDFESACSFFEKPDDSYRPGGNLPEREKHESLPAPDFKFVNNRARKVIWCCECGKPRLLYSKQYLTDDENRALELAIENFDYSCGGPFIKTGHHLEKTIFVRLNINCNTKISAQYYNMGSKIDGFKMICFNCLEEYQPAIE